MQRKNLTKKISRILNLLIILLLFELFFIVYYLALDKKYISVQEKLLLEKNSAILNTDNNKDCNRVALTGHPYLVFIHKYRPSCPHTTNNAGFQGKDFPLEKSNDTFFILVTGGSVPHQLVERQNSLETEFNKQYSVKNKKIVVLNGSLDAWKMPQQVIMLMLYANVIDAVISIDGFNEVIFPRREKYQYKLDLPFEGAYKKAYPGNLSSKSIIAYSTNQFIYNAMRSNFILMHSKTAYFISTVIKKYLSRAISNNDEDVFFNETKRKYKLPDNWSEDQRRKYIVEQYKTDVRMMYAINSQLNIRYAHFIQPVPAVDKKLTREEMVAVNDLSYRDDYLFMTSSLLELKDENIPIYSLINIYAHTNESLYIDNIHQKKDSRGNDMLIDAIVNQVAKDWKFQKR